MYSSLLRQYKYGNGWMIQIYRQFSGPIQLSFDKFGNETTDRSPLVILHGLFGQKTNWQTIAHKLSDRLKTVIFTLDLRNHGDSPWCTTMTYAEMANDVQYFIDEIIPKQIGKNFQVHLLGHSMGGKTAMRVALMKDSDKRLKSLIIEDIAPRAYNVLLSFPRIIEAMKSIDLTRDRSEIERELALTVTDRTTRLFLLMNLLRVDKNCYRWRLNLDSIGHHLRELRSAGIQDEGIYNGRCLFVSGARSEYVMRSDHPLILKRFPNAQFSVIPQAAHWVHAEKPYEFMDIISNFICSVEAQPTK